MKYWFLLFIFLVAFITFSWFRSGLLYGGAEIGIFAYNIQRVLDIQKFIWWGGVAPGMLVPQFITSIPLYFAFSLLSFVSSPLILQIITSFFLLLIMGYGMYIFSLQVLGREKKNYAILAIIFYMFNSYTMVDIWHRFLYTGFFLAAFLPLLAYFWKRWIDSGKTLNLILFLLINLVCSYMFGNLTSVIAEWIVCLLLTLGNIFFPWQNKKILLRIFYKFIMGFILFILTNLWWLLPVLKVSTSVLPQQHTSEDDLSTLVDISRQAILPYSLQFANPFYLFSTSELGAIYNNFIFLILPWVPIILIFIGLIVSLKKRNLAIFGISYLLSIFISKGSALPFGYAYIWSFMHFYILGVLRNPFEKIGILLPLFGSILFSLGMNFVWEWGIQKKRIFLVKFLFTLILTSILLYGLPILTGDVFNKPIYSLKVNVPSYYAEANEWFKSQNDKGGNILHLPFPSHDVVTYQWENGYHGVEINETLFTQLPSITRNVGIERIDNTLSILPLLFSGPKKGDPNQILRILNSLNIYYIVLHNDTVWDDTTTYGKNINHNNPKEIQTALEELPFIEKSAQFGDLIIYKIKQDYSEPKITFYDKADIVYPGKENITELVNLTSNSNLLVSPYNGNNNTSAIQKIIIFPEETFYFREYTKSFLEDRLNQVLQNPDNPSLPSNKIIAMKKEILSNTGNIIGDLITKNIISARQDLLEILNNENSDQVSSLLDDYKSRIDEIFSKYSLGTSINRDFQDIIANAFTTQSYILSKLAVDLDTVNKNKAQEIYKILNGYLVKNNIFPLFSPILGSVEKDSMLRVNRFDVPNDDKYHLFMEDANELKYYDINNLKVQVDGSDIKNKATINNGVMDFGKITLNQGIHEISYLTIPINFEEASKFTMEGDAQAVDEQTLKLSAGNQLGSAVYTDLPHVYGGDTYEISFDAQTDNTKTIYIQTIEDTQKMDDKSDCSKINCYPLDLTDSQNWQNYSIRFNPLDLNTSKAWVRILLPNSNSDTSLLIKNIKLNRLMDSNLFLTKTQDNISSSSAKPVVSNKISPIQYTGSINIEKPGYVFFKESFNPNWILSLKSDNSQFKYQPKFVGDFYGNVFYVDKVGRYDFNLYFDPQKYVNYGIALSLLGYGIIFLSYIIEKIRHKNES